MWPEGEGERPDQLLGQPGSREPGAEFYAPIQELYPDRVQLISEPLIETSTDE
jgi:hypothetical protein